MKIRIWVGDRGSSVEVVRTTGESTILTAIGDVVINEDALLEAMDKLESAVHLADKEGKDG